MDTLSHEIPSPSWHRKEPLRRGPRQYQRRQHCPHSPSIAASTALRDLRSLSAAWSADLLGPGVWPCLSWDHWSSAAGDGWLVLPGSRSRFLSAHSLLLPGHNFPRQPHLDPDCWTQAPVCLQPTGLPLTHHSSPRSQALLQVLSGH